MKYLKAGLIVLIVGAIGLCQGTAHAESENNWHVSVGGATGVTMDGGQYSIMDAIVETPQDAPDWFKVLPTKAWHRYVVTPNGNEINISRFEYKLGVSNNFFGAAYRDSDDVAIGVSYVPEHWNIDWLNNFTFSGFIKEGGEYILGLDSDYVIADGYGINTHVLLHLDNDLNKDKFDGNVGFYHNFVEDGSLRGELGYASWVDENFVYFIVKGTL